MMKVHHHHEAHFRSSRFLRDVVIGVSDGLTVPFALAAGLTGAVDSNALIVTAGIAEIAAGAISMGLGGYLAGKTELAHYEGELRREYREVEEIPEVEKQEVREVFAAYGLSESAKDVIVAELAKDKDRWVEFMMRFELGLDEPDKAHASQSGLRIGISYALGGVVPLIGYLVTSKPSTGLMYSTLMTLACLGIFGYLKSKLTGESPYYGALKVMIIGSVAALVAFSIAKLANGIF